MKKNFSLFVLILIVLTSRHCLSLTQEDNSSKDSVSTSYYIFGSYLLNNQNANFSQLPGIPNCCPHFSSGDGTGFSIGIGTEMPLPYSLGFGLRLAYGFNKTTLTNRETTFIRLDDKLTAGAMEHSLVARIGDIALEPLLSFNPFFDMKFFIGGHIGMIVQKEFEQKEELKEPANRGIFVDTGTRTRNKRSGEIPDANTVLAGMIFGASYGLPMNKNGSLTISPEVFYFIGMTNIVRSLEWKSNYLRIGLALTYMPKPEEKLPSEEFREIRQIDTVIITNDNVEKKHISIGKEATKTTVARIADTILTTNIISRTDTLFQRYAPKTDVTSSVDIIYISSQYVTEAFPTLNRIFFEAGSSEFSNFYNTKIEPEKFSVDSLETNPFTFHRNLLNIIGSRMREHEKAIISIKGFSDQATEDADCALAESRASAVKKYLIDYWKIDEKRIKILKSDGVCTPSDPTITQSESGYAENRRVEITTNAPEILAPIVRRKFLEITDFTPQSINYDFSKASSATKTGVAAYEISIAQGNNEFIHKTGKGLPPSQSMAIDRKAAEELNGSQPLKAIIKITDSEGNEAIATKDIKVIKDTAEYEIQRFSLILFSVKSDVIPDKAKSDIIKELKGIDSDARIRITGYTDIIGSPELNKTLSENRANNTAKLIRENYPDANILSVTGVASMKYPPGITSYATAAERFLSRTVQIEILRRYK